MKDKSDFGEVIKIRFFRVRLKEPERREKADCEYRQFFQGVFQSRE